MTISTILMIVAVVLLFCAAFSVPSSRVVLGWLGMAIWATSILIGGVVIR